jgi:hypothetical protein
MVDVTKLAEESIFVFNNMVFAFTKLTVPISSNIIFIVAPFDDK